jgi:hypothetical protein
MDFGSEYGLDFESYSAPRPKRRRVRRRQAYRVVYVPVRSKRRKRRRRPRRERSPGEEIYGALTSPEAKQAYRTTYKGVKKGASVAYRGAKRGFGFIKERVAPKSIYKKYRQG